MKRAFLCHSSVDKSIVEAIAKEFISNGIEVWLDKWEIRAGDSIIEKISEGLSKNDFLIAFLSRKSVKSNWVKREMNIALTRELRTKRTRVIPVLLENCDIPKFLSDKKYIDFSSVNFNTESFKANLQFIQSFEDLVSALMDDDTIPFYTSSCLKAAIVDKLSFIIEFDKPAKYDAVVKQSMLMKPTRKMDRWLTSVTYFGKVKNFHPNLGTYNYENTSKGSRLFRINLGRFFFPGDQFDLSFQYDLINNFREKNLFWDMYIGVHTLTSAFRFHFKRKIKHFKIFKRITETELFLKEIKPVDKGGKQFKIDFDFIPSYTWIIFRWQYIEQIKKEI